MLVLGSRAFGALVTCINIVKVDAYRDSVSYSLYVDCTVSTCTVDGISGLSIILACMLKGPWKPYHLTISPSAPECSRVSSLWCSVNAKSPVPMRMKSAASTPVASHSTHHVKQ